MNQIKKLTEYDGFKVYYRGGYANIRIDRLVSVPLHRYIWQKANGVLPRNRIIHHIDGKPLNNDLSNLEALTPRDHVRLHSNWVRNKAGDWTHKPCGRCKKIKPLSAFYRCGTGYSGPCKGCNDMNTTAYVKANRVKIRAYTKTWNRRAKGLAMIERHKEANALVPEKYLRDSKLVPIEEARKAVLEYEQKRE